MFNVDEFFKLMSYLKDGTEDADLSSITQNLATSEKERIAAYFENVLDQQVFSSDDFRRLRPMLIDWYSTHRTVAASQKNSSDVYTMPDNNLSELFRSFGFVHGLNLVPLTHKANFFLDLVNFYKKKGTPETLADVLDYYGFSDTDLVEYWLQKDRYGNIIFRGESVRTAATGSTMLLDGDVAFEKLTDNDPHWMMSKAEVESLFLTNKISLPSKSPYYSLSSVFDLKTINISVSILQRVIIDQFDRYSDGLEIARTVAIKNIGYTTSLLEVYLASTYVFEKIFGKAAAPINFSNYYHTNLNIDYSGDPPLPINLSSLISEYNNLIKRPINRADRNSMLNTLHSDWTKDISEHWMEVGVIDAESILSSINPDLKSLCDTWYASGEITFLISYLIGTLDDWIRTNIDSKSPSLVITILGLGFREELDEILNFFVPYRARLAYMDTAFSINDPLTESFLIDDKFYTNIEQTDIEVLNFSDVHLQQIYQTIIDESPCKDIIYRNWDEHPQYDAPIETIYFNDHVDIDISQNTNEVIDINDSVSYDLSYSFADNRGRVNKAEMYDIGQSYDTLYPNAICTDYLHIFISSLGISSSQSDVEADLTIGDFEELSATAGISADINSSISFGVLEVLKSVKASNEAKGITTVQSELYVETTINISEKNGVQGPSMFDLNNIFDVPLQKSIVTDSVEIIII